MIYQRPLADGVYSPPQTLSDLPIQQYGPQALIALNDVTGAGRLDVMVIDPRRAGFYANNGDGTWRPFRPFEAVANRISDPATQFVDLSGDGRTDACVLALGVLEASISARAAGFPDLTTHDLPEDFPAAADPGERELHTFADMIGDGLQHRVRIADGCVEVWPSLGGGRFGGKVTMAGAPRFPPSLKRERILLGDFIGAGAADLLLVDDDVAELYPNAGGNAFLPPIRFEWPFCVSDLDSIDVIDIFDIGAPALVVGQAGASGRHGYFLIGSDQPTLGLYQVDNGRGEQTTLTYRSAIAYQFKARAAGEPWTTRLASPVTVLESVVTRDAVNSSTRATSFQYRDGRWDPVERSFAGFGEIMQQDALVFDRAGGRASDAMFETQLVKSWRQTGAAPSLASSAAVAARGFGGDAAAITFPPASFAPEIAACDEATVAEAWFAIQGTEFRTEIFAVDDKGVAAAASLSVEQSGYFVKMLQPRLDGHHAVLQVTPREAATSIYEACADDPRIEHHAIVEQDAYGHPTRTLSVHYPRRPAAGRDVIPGQDTLRVTATLSDCINMETPCYRLGVPYQTRSYEIAAAAQQARYFSFEELAALIDPALTNQVAYGEPFAVRGVSARLYAAERIYYWDAAQTASLPLGQCAPQPLASHTDSAVFPEGFAEQLFGARLTSTMLTQDCRYYLSDGLWWTTGAELAYLDARGVLLPCRVAEPFQVGTSAATVTEYDPYFLTPARVTDPLGHSVSATLDLQPLRACEVTDPNGVVSQALFDPLARVIATGVHGQIGGRYAGNMDLAQFRKLTPPASVDDVLAKPDAYLQGAGMFFFYDDLAWLRSGQPIHHLSLVSESFVDDPQGAAPAGPIRIGLIYQDGAGANVCDKVAVETSYALAADLPPAAASDQLWIVGSQMRLDARGNPAQRFTPYFSRHSAFEQPGADQPHFNYRFDALDRIVRTDMPDGHFTRAAYGAWSKIYHDENDTTEGRFDFDTPSADHFDNRGLSIMRSRVNVEPDETGRTLLNEFSVLDAQGRTLAEIDARFFNPTASLRPARWNFQYVYDMLGNALMVESIDAGAAAPGRSYVLATSAGDVAHSWDARGVKTTTNYENPLRRPSSTVVTQGGLSAVWLRLLYGADPAQNNVNQTIVTMDEAGRIDAPSFDLLGHALTLTRRYCADCRAPVDWSDPDKVALDPAWIASARHNALGELIERTLADGTRTAPKLYRNGQVQAVETTFAGEAVARTVARFQYNANGQSREVALGNTITRAIEYTPELSRLSRIQCRRGAESQPLQDLTRGYDPVGNVVSLANGVEPVRFVSDQTVAPDTTY
ncbi:MAG: VCBS repeat-containing protein [Pseudomonadota bacterium]|nr:VCBS repeat-containing protein [Pseudomonadota bacterium]